MAKQRGLHQIKGKVGEYSYYNQTGVSGGLIRKINEGLSARVKTDPAYANTRLNNREFGAAADTSALLGKTVNPKFRPMILPFSQSKMAKAILELARSHAAMWGQRVVTSADTARLCEILTAQSKKDFNELISISITRSQLSEADIIYDVNEEQETFMSSLGIDAMNVVCVQYDIATGQWVPLALQMTTGYVVRNNSATIEVTGIQPGGNSSGSETIETAAFVPESDHAGHQIVVMVAMPMRTINGVAHILQEYCAFKAVELPAVA